MSTKPTARKVFHNEWHRVLISEDSRRHYYVNRHTGVLTVRQFGEVSIKPNPVAMARSPFTETNQAGRNAEAWLAQEGITKPVVVDGPGTPDA